MVLMYKVRRVAEMSQHINGNRMIFLVRTIRCAEKFSIWGMWKRIDYWKFNSSLGEYLSRVGMYCTISSAVNIKGGRCRGAGNRSYSPIISTTSPRGTLCRGRYFLTESSRGWVLLGGECSWFWGGEGGTLVTYIFDT